MTDSDSGTPAPLILGAVAGAPDTVPGGVTILVTSAPGPYPDIAAQPDEEGRFVLTTVGPGDYTILAVTADGRRAESTVHVADSSVEATIRLP
ncbi:hypothetical protein OG921_25125 [Aldersonia sp. NBC_00410]|uniref:hypothetical protein n=1 Tax=Aldersonia sp. NBC_00410 TaxID=2975954 RepID=UPI00225937D4|nr:hypothetical protein [Aldersonia sp. NBC_00410]MCX5046458.1 hypothetical protein [Aldersonia sp. NBC_00410]